MFMNCDFICSRVVLTILYSIWGYYRRIEGETIVQRQLKFKSTSIRVKSRQMEFSCAHLFNIMSMSELFQLIQVLPRVG